MKYTSSLSNTAKRQLKRLGRQERERIYALIDRILEAPYTYKPLSGELSGTRTARIGNLRVIYAVDEKEKRVNIIYAGHRERVYEG